MKTTKLHLTKLNFKKLPLKLTCCAKTSNEKYSYDYLPVVPDLDIMLQILKQEFVLACFMAKSSVVIRIMIPGLSRLER